MAKICTFQTYESGSSGGGHTEMWDLYQKQKGIPIYITLHTVAAGKDTTWDNLLFYSWPGNA